MRKTALVIMAAGIGSRYGAGIKQLAKVGPGGEIIIAYSVHDALAAGFDKIIFIIRKDIEEEFRDVIGNRIEKVADVSYVFQDLRDVPAGFRVPEGRTKPWGTAHAVWSVRDVVDCPFMVINADDFYGADSFRTMHDYLVDRMSPAGDVYDFCMAGFRLGNTLSEKGTVARGICRTDEAGNMLSVTETYHISRHEDGVIRGDDGNGRVLDLPEETPVSMNMWGLQPVIFDVLTESFRSFMTKLETMAPEDRLKAEFQLPSVIDSLIHTGRASVRVLPVHEKWYGVTYHEDRQSIMKAIADMVSRNIYKEKLFG